MQGIRISIILSVFLSCLLTGQFAMSQGGELYIFGLVKDYADGKKLENVKITAFQGGNKVDEYTTTGNGKYEFFLELGKEYELSFGRKGFVSKKVYMDSRNIPAEDIGAGFSMNIEMSLFEEIEGLDVSILEQPIGKAKYNVNTGALEFDFAYTQKIKDEISRLMREWEKGSKDKQSTDQAKEKELQALEKEFTKLVDAADKAFLKEAFQESVADYKAALELKPDNPMVQIKLKSAEEKLLQSNAFKAEQEKYDAALKAGDDFMRTEDFEKAISKYEEALAIRKDEAYPKNQITEARGKLDAKKKAEEDEARFTELVRKGDNFVKALDYQEGIVQYNEALSIKPNDQNVQNKIKSAQDALANIEKEKELKAQYDALVAQADEQFRTEAYDASIEKYEEALKIKPEEQHPAKRIEEARKRLDDLKKAAEEEQRLQEVEAAFNKLVNDGNEQFAAEKYNEAIAKYESALELKPNDQTVTKKIADARTRLDELANQQALNAQYDDAIQQGDAARNSKEYQAAIGLFEKASGLKPKEAYPKDQIAAIKEILAEQARVEKEKQEEEERKKAEEKRLAEEMAQFNALVASGDEFFGQKKYQNAIDQYNEALKIKPDNQHLPKKIKESQRLLEEMRALQNQEQIYNEAIAEGDQKFKARNYEGAIAAFDRALGIKPDEAHPKNQLAAIQQALLNEEKKQEEEALAAKKQEEEARLKAKAAEATMKRDEFNRIIKLGDGLMKEKEYNNAKIRYNEALEVIPNDPDGLAKLAEADRLLNEQMGARELNKKYNMMIADADAAFGAQLLQDARAHYQEALELKPGETHPAVRIKEIDDLLLTQQRHSEKEREAEMAAQKQKEKEEEQRRLKEQQQSEKSALEEEYNVLIEVADRKYAASDYDIALRNYQEALRLKPEEFYPKSRIQEIELLLREQAERRAEEERQAELAREKEHNRAKAKRSGSTVDTQSEDEAERFMREARLREEAEKYEQIRRLKDRERNRQLEARSGEVDRSSNYLVQVESYKKQSDQLYENATDAQKQSTQRMQNYKGAYETGRSKELEKERKTINRSVQSIAEERELIATLQEVGENRRSEMVAEINQRINNHLDYVESQIKTEQDKSKKAYQQVKEVQEAEKNRQTEFTQRQSEVTAKVMNTKREHEAIAKKRIQRESEQRDQAQAQINEQREQQLEMPRLAEKINQGNIESVSEQKSRIDNQQKRQNDLAEQRAMKAREDLHALKATAPKDFTDYYLSTLAQEYPQGVTEESDNIGNKVVIRRIVVIGNKADEFRKVIDKTGKYYFKNGNSISELTWNRETNPTFD